jgi:flagellar hook-associated protein 2
MAVTFGGISSGIDTKAIIQATIAAQRVPINQLNTKKSGYNAQISNLGQLASKLSELQTLAKDMSKTSNVLAFTFGIGDDKVIGATADGAASAGRYDLEVTQLAQAEKNRSTAFASNFSEVRAGTLTIQTPGDDAVEVTIDEGMTLEDLVDRINGSGAKVDASIVRDGTSSFLQLTASESGHEIGGSADDAIVLTENYTGVAGQALGLTQVVQAKNATFTVDGLPIESRTNKPTDVLPGLELDLKKLGTSTLEVAPDKAGTKEKMKAFVDLVNGVMDLVKSSTRTSDGARKAEPDPTIERLGTELRSLLIESVPGLPSDRNSLARIGLSMNATGKLEIDNTRFDAALDKDIRSIGRLFTNSEDGLSTKLESILERYTESVDGVLTNRKKALNGRVDQLDQQMERMETRLGRTQSTLERQFAAMEQALAGIQAQGQALTSLLYGL